MSFDGFAILDMKPQGYTCPACKGEMVTADSWDCRTCFGAGVQHYSRSALWCLGHNFDIVGALMSMASLSWQQGFDAGRTIGSLCEPVESEQSEGSGPVCLSKDSGD